MDPNNNNYYYYNYVATQSIPSRLQIHNC